MARQTYDATSNILDNTVVYGSQGRWLAGNTDFLHDNQPIHEWPLTIGVLSKQPYTELEYNRLHFGHSAQWRLDHLKHRFVTWWDGTESYMAFEGVVRAVTGGNETLTVTLTAYNLTDHTLETGNDTITYLTLNNAKNANEEDAGIVSYEMALTDAVVPAQGLATPVRAMFQVELQANNIADGDEIDFWAASLLVYTTPSSRSS